MRTAASRPRTPAGSRRSTIATWLHDAGYRTGLFGKYLNGYPDGSRDDFVPPGWDEFDSPTRGGNPYGEYGYNLNENGRIVHYGSSPRDYGTDVYTRLAEDFISRSEREGRPFFAYLPLYSPHSPATPAPRSGQPFPHAQAPRAPSYNEANLGDKPSWLRDAPLMTPHDQSRAWTRSTSAGSSRSRRSTPRSPTSPRRCSATGSCDNTYVVFASDNGYHLGQHRMPAGKQTAYDEDIHVPFIVRGPGVPAGRHARSARRATSTGRRPSRSWPG